MKLRLLSEWLSIRAWKHVCIMPLDIESCVATRYTAAARSLIIINELDELYGGEQKQSLGPARKTIAHNESCVSVVN